MIHIRREHMAAITSHSTTELPNEACGLVAGTLTGDTKVVEAVYHMTNTDKSPEHFSMDPREQFQVIREVRNRGWVILGNYHSHPGTPARPSREDIRLAFDSSLSYFILSLREPGQPVLKSFKIDGGQVKEEELVVMDQGEQARCATNGQRNTKCSDSE